MITTSAIELVSVLIGKVLTTTFDQRGQHVSYQYTVAGNINFALSQSRMNLAAELEKLKIKFDIAVKHNSFDFETNIEVGTRLDLAMVETKKE